VPWVDSFLWDHPHTVARVTTTRLVDAAPLSRGETYHAPGGGPVVSCGIADPHGYMGTV